MRHLTIAQPRHRRSVLLTASALLAALPGAAGHAAAGDVIQHGNTYYLVVPRPQGVTWLQAFHAAEAMVHNGRQGHLATVTSAAEQQFFMNHPVLNDAMNNIFYFGGYRASTSPDPAAGWRWVTGEVWGYTNWSEGEPNDMGGDEGALQFWTDETLGRWNDNPIDYPEPGFIVEFSPPSVNCRADWNTDGDVLPADVAMFVNDWMSSLSHGHLIGDFNFDRMVTPADVAAYVTTFFENVGNGC